MSTRFLTRLRLVVIVTFMTSVFPTAPARAQTCEYWVAPAPTGNDSYPGTFTLPWATFEHAADTVPDSDCIVWFEDGTYTGHNSVDARFATPTTFKAVHPYKAILQYSGIALKIAGARNIIVEGFEFRHTGPGADPLMVEVRRKGDTGPWSERITLHNNIFHDSYNSDLLKIYDGARFITVENNIFYNQGSNEQHMDVNSVTDVVIQDNIFFNDFAGSGRINTNDTKAFIVVKDSNEGADGLLGSERVAIRRNVFLNWEGGAGEPFLQIGNDGKPYHEAKNVRIENNLLIGNALHDTGGALAVSGARDVTFANNTIVGDLPISSGYAFRVDIKGLNPLNQNIFFYNNIWADPTGTMGTDVLGDLHKFSKGDPSQTLNLVLDNNLYWNDDAAIPPGQLVSPLVNDTHRVVANPLLNTNQTALVLPRWNGASFLSGSTSIRQEFLRLVERYGKIPLNSLAIGRANPAFTPADDILGQSRIAPSSLGAYRQGIILTGYSELMTIWLNWSEARVQNAASLAITYTRGSVSNLVTGILTSTQAYSLTNLSPYSLYAITLTARSASHAVLAQSNTLVLLTTDLHVYLPLVNRNTP